MLRLWTSLPAAMAMKADGLCSVPDYQEPKKK
jgi:hypothetical protein